MKVSIIGDYASLSIRIGSELISRGYDVEYFLQDNIYSDLPKKYHKLGSVQGSLIKNYFFTAFWTIFGNLFKQSDIQIVNGTYPNCVRTRKTCYYYTGSDLRLGKTKPRSPSFVSLKELLDYSKDSIFLQRSVDPEMFFPIKEIKEKKEIYKQENGIDYIVGHFAHSPQVKGSHLFKQAIDKINKNEDIKIEYIDKPIPKEKIVEAINFCDIVLDHINPTTGKSYNVISIEALLCEVPVGSYYEEKYLDFEEMKDLVHYIDPNPGETEENILSLLRQKISVNREIPIKLHSPKIVTDILISYWKKWGFI